MELEELRKNDDESFTVKTGEHAPIAFALAICYIEDTGHENEYFSDIGEDCLDASVEEMDEILNDFGTFLKHNLTAMTNVEKRECNTSSDLICMVKNLIEKYRFY